MKVPRKKGAVVSSTGQRIVAELNLAAKQLQFFGSGKAVANQRWRLRGGALQAKRLSLAPGESASDTTLTGSTLKAVTLKTRSYAVTAECIKICRQTTGCAAVVSRGTNECILKSSVGKPVRKKGHIAWVNPKTKRPPEAPGPPSPGKTITGWSFQGGDIGRPMPASPWLSARSGARATGAALASSTTSGNAPVGSRRYSSAKSRRSNTSRGRDSHFGSPHRRLPNLARR